MNDLSMKTGIWVIGLLLLLLTVLLSGCDNCPTGDDFCPIPILSAEGQAPMIDDECPSAELEMGGALHDG